MPRPRDQRLYFELQGKLTQQEVDYNNMHQHHTIVRAPHGKVTKISNDQYHDSMEIDEIEHVAGQRAVVAQDFKPVDEQPPSRKASEPKKNGDDPIPSKPATEMRRHNLRPLPTEPPRGVVALPPTPRHPHPNKNAAHEENQEACGGGGRRRRRWRRRTGRRWQRRDDRAGGDRAVGVGDERRERRAAERVGDSGPVGHVGRGVPGVHAIPPAHAGRKKRRKKMLRDDAAPRGGRFWASTAQSPTRRKSSSRRNCAAAPAPTRSS